MAALANATAQTNIKNAVGLALNAVLISFADQYGEQTQMSSQNDGGSPPTGTYPTVVDLTAQINAAVNTAVASVLTGNTVTNP